MAKPYAEELVYAESEDGILLSGVVTRPAEVTAKPVAVVWIHGYPVSPRLPLAVTMARLLAGHGYTFVAGDTRGHDIASLMFRKDGTAGLGGAWWEKFDESPRDVGAWVSFAAGLGFPSVVLLGHSFGAVKAVYYQAQRQDPRVLGLIVAAPGLRMRAWGPAHRPTPERTVVARKLVAEGRGQALLPWEPFGTPGGTISAQTYVSWLDANIDVFGLETPEPAVARIRCPLYACYGTDDALHGTAADLEVIRRNARAAARVDTALFEGADHLFTGHEAELAAALAGWIDRLV